MSDNEQQRQEAELKEKEFVDFMERIVTFVDESLPAERRGNNAPNWVDADKRVQFSVAFQLLVTGAYALSEHVIGKKSKTFSLIAQWANREYPQALMADLQTGKISQEDVMRALGIDPASQPAAPDETPTKH